MWIASSLNRVLTPTAAALGNFDGVHRGHVQVIQPALDFDAPVMGTQAKIVPASESPELGGKTYSTVVTFSPHPQEFFSGQPRALLTPAPEKVRVLEALGVDQLVLLPFNRELASLSAEDFVTQILIQGLRCQSVSVGKDFRFGQKRAGTIVELRSLLAPHGVKVETVALKQSEGRRISSSRVREALLAGEVAIANELLGYRYQLQGPVIQGQQLGRTIGFPTANLQVDEQKFLPRHGVYAVWVSSLAVPGLEQPQPGVMNIGDRPTVNGQAVTVEVHLLDWQGDLYGKGLTVELVDFIRPQQKFDGLDALKAQIGRDCAQAQALFQTTR